jgi:hypothetical protein
MILLAVATIAVAALPSAAEAGTYDVPACFGGGPNRSWQPRADSFTQVSAVCAGGAGIEATNRLASSLAPPSSNAALVFTAPPGTRITRVRGDIKENGTGGWMAGLHDETARQWINCCTTLNTWQPFNIGRGMTSVAALLHCGGSGGCQRDLPHGRVALRNVVVTVEDNGPPRVVIRGGGLVAPGWHRLQQEVAIERSDPVGIKQMRLAVDGQRILVNDYPCDSLRAVPCENSAAPLMIDTRTIGDGFHKLRVEAIDGAGNASAVERTIAIDNHPPTTPQRLSVDDGRGWRSRPTFTLRWATPKQSAAPVVGAFIQVCPEAAARSGCEKPQWVERVSAAAVQVPSAGEWRARVWLRDAAGNANSTAAADALLRMDNTAPTLALQRPAPDRPALVRVTASDDASGLLTRELSLRRRGSSSWISLPVSLHPGGFAAAINDERLPDGVYELRARAVDLAGNERSTDRLADGKKAELALPLRVKTSLRVGRPIRVRARGSRGKRRYRIKLVEKPQARYGRTIPLRGRLTSPGGNPLPGRDVRVYEQTKLAAAPWRLIATVRTSRNGRFTFKALRGPSRTLRFRFGGSDTIRGRTADVRLGVRASTTLIASRRHVVNGEDVTFRGRLRGWRPPSTGKLVELQAYARGHWLTFRTVRADARSGRWRYTYRFSATRGSVRYRFRAKVPREAGYPFETGTSRRVEVRVRGL